MRVIFKITRAEAAGLLCHILIKYSILRPIFALSAVHDKRHFLRINRTTRMHTLTKRMVFENELFLQLISSKLG